MSEAPPLAERPTPGRPRIVILGASYAGMTAAHRLGRQVPGAEVILVDRNAHWSERIRMHELAVGGGGVQRIDVAELMAPRGVRFIAAEVVALDPAAQVVTVKTAGGTATRLGFDYALLALGSRIAPRSPGLTGDSVVSLDSPAEAQVIHDHLTRQPDAKVLVVGGGLTGIEAACEIAEAFRDARVTLAAGSAWRRDDGPGGFEAKAIQHMDRTLQRLGVTTVASRVASLEDRLARFADGSSAPYHVCIWTAGFTPSALGRDAGLAVTEQGQVAVDPALRSRSHPNILAVGDLAGVATAASGPCRMGCATALPMGVAAARTLTALLAGRAPPAFEFDYLFRCVSLGRRDGLIQFVDSRDRPRKLVWTGEKAAAWKDYICRATLGTFGATPMPSPPLSPPVRMLPQLLRLQKQYA